jgi:hypothetical protein
VRSVGQRLRSSGDGASVALVREPQNPSACPAVTLRILVSRRSLAGDRREHVPINPWVIIGPTLFFAALVTVLWTTHHE